MVRRKSWEAIAVVAFLIVTAVIVTAVVKVVWFPGTAFDSTVWRNSNTADNSVRYPMAARLVAQGSLKGKSRAEVLALLGEPDPYTDLSGPEYRYFVDRYPAVIIFNSRYLVVRFGPGDRVAEVKLDTL